QAASVAAISFIVIVKGHSIPRLNGVIGGIYSNPNDLAFAIVLSLPFCLAFLMNTRVVLWKITWSLAMLVMMLALFLTASRGGFVVLVVAGTICLWHFGVKGRRFLLIVASAFLGIALLLVAGRTLTKRFLAISSEAVDSQLEETAHASYL